MFLFFLLFLLFFSSTSSSSSSLSPSLYVSLCVSCFRSPLSLPTFVPPPSLHLSHCSSVLQYLCQKFVCLSVFFMCVSLCISVCLPVCLSVCLSICLSVSLSSIPCGRLPATRRTTSATLRQRDDVLQGRQAPPSDRQQRRSLHLAINPRQLLLFIFSCSVVSYRVQSGHFDWRRYLARGHFKAPD